HFVFAEGGDKVASIHDDKSYLHQLSMRTRSITQGKDQTIEVVTSEDGKQPEEATPPEPPKPVPTAEKKPEPPKPEPPKQQEAKKPEPPKQEVKVVAKEDDPLKKLD